MANFEDYSLLGCEAVCYGRAYPLFYPIEGVGTLLSDVYMCTATAMKTAIYLYRCTKYFVV